MGLPLRLLILGSRFDRVADAVATLVAAAGGSVLWCSLEDLAAARWHHRLGADGVETELTLKGGRRVAGDVVLNRLRFEPTLLYTRMGAADRDYARAEFRALLLSWLGGMGDQVVGRALPSGLGGAAPGAWQWLAAAAAAGFAAYPAAATTSARRADPPTGLVPWPDLLPQAFDPALDLMGSDRPCAHGAGPVAARRIIVVGHRVVGDEDEDVAAAAVRLARSVDTDILAIDLAQAPGDPRWRFASADSLPETLGEPALDAVLALIEARR